MLYLIKRDEIDCEDTTPCLLSYTCGAGGNRGILTYYAGFTNNYHATNDLNQYTSVGGAPITNDANGNIQSRDGWTYVYDAQNRLRSAIKGGTRLDFYYDGLNRQITRGLNYGSDVTFSVWDGWNLLEERGLGNVLKRVYFWGGATDELVCAFGGQYNNSWFTQDGRGNTSHISDDGNNLVERYTYGLSGEPQIWDPSGNARSDAITANRFMFQGRDYLKEGGIYDYRNRFYLPPLGRFIQTDPLSFRGGDANLYRYCGGDSVNGSDPDGLQEKQRTKPHDPTIQTLNGRGGGDATTDSVVVSAPYDWSQGSSRPVSAVTGGLDSLNQGGGRASGTSGGGIRLTRNSNGLGITRAKTPRGTQGWWTNPEGLPTGTSWTISDGQITEELEALYLRKLRGVNVAGMSAEDYIKFMKFLDTRFFSNADDQFYYVGGYYGAAGLYYGGELNYIGVGEGFAARGVSVSDMKATIVGWKAWNFNNSSGTFRGSEFHWAIVGYFAYPFYRDNYH